MQDGCLTFAGFLMKDIFIWWDKAFPGCRVNALTEKNVYVSLCILVLLFTSLLCCIVKIFIKLLQGHSNLVSKVFICSQSLKDQTFCDVHPGNSHLAIVMPGVQERKPPRQCNSQKREVYCWLESGLLPHPTQWWGVREPRAQAVTQIYRVSISSW